MRSTTNSILRQDLPASALTSSDTDQTSPMPTWTMQRGPGPLVAAAIHNGHLVREEIRGRLALDDDQRRREEDPCTGAWTTVAENRVVSHRSRFEFDLNRPRRKAVYQHPEDAWNLQVWKEPLSKDCVLESLALYDAFYRDLRLLLDDVIAANGYAVVFDIHSYNHRRESPDQAADPNENPEVNVGVGTLDQKRWSPVLDRFLFEMRDFPYFERHLDVRTNVKFFGGQMCSWIHQNYPTTACALAIEFKKFFMDEWTGEPFRADIAMLGEALSCAGKGVVEEMHRYA